MHNLAAWTTIRRKARQDDPSKRWKYFAMFLLLFSFCVIIGMAAIIIYYEMMHYGSTNTQTLPMGSNIQSGDFLFQDLTGDEMKAIERYIMNESSFNIKPNTGYDVKESFFFMVELYLPNKTDMINTMKHKVISRNAKIILIRGDLEPPCVEEYVLGPLNNITFHHLLVSKYYQKSAPFLYRPFSKLDHSMLNKIVIELENTIGHILQNSYEATFLNCDSHCLKLEFFSPMTPSVTGDDSRIVWYWVHHDVENYLLYPVDLFLLIDMTNTGENSSYNLKQIWYGSKQFDSAQQLANEYQNGNIKTSYIPYIKKFREIKHLDGYHLQPPALLYPDGKRFSVLNNHVQYGNWNFDVHMSTTTGPSVLNVKFNDIEYAYEISLQEISVFHSGYKRWIRYSDMTYSGFLLGTKAKKLVLGADCPAVSTFIHTAHVFGGQFNPQLFPNSFCVFEQPSGMILRRHYSPSYSGLEDISLVVRTILTLQNYDHVFDFVFHQNGVLDVRTSYSGYPLPTIYSPEEDRHGFRVYDEVSVNIHHHACHFKIDIDVLGSKNRFETFDVMPKTHDGDWIIKSNEKYEQLKLTRSLKLTEEHASFKSDIGIKSQFIFYNSEHLTSYKDPRGIRLEVKSDKNPYATTDIGNEASVSWKRYLLAVSKRHDDEPSSSSIYSLWDAKNPFVKFQKYLDDNESIVDEDLVAWVTLSTTHIPHSEDFPAMSTSTNQQYFTLSPFNLFQHNPSMNSPDKVKQKTSE